MADQIRICSATAEHVLAVLALWSSAGSVPTITDRTEFLLALLEADPGALLVAESAGVVVGSLIAAWDGWRGSFYRLAVDGAHRRRGVGGQLVRAGERRLRQVGAIRLAAIVDTEEEAALAFWTAIGYERQEDRARFVRVLA